MNRKEMNKTLMIISNWRKPFGLKQNQNQRFNPLNPHDALKHHFTSLKTDLIFLQLRVF